MTEISPEERQKAKTAAANAAVASNDAAVVLGVAGLAAAGIGAASGVGALAGVAVGATLGICSFGAWWVGNRYQRLANDPSRSDFDEVTTTSAFLVEEALPIDEPDATVARFAAQQLVLVDALSALVTSIERCDGATDAGDSAAAAAQAEAAQQNAQAAVSAISAQVQLSDALNQAWSATLEMVDLTSLTIDQVQENFREAVGDPAQAPGTALQGVFATVTGLSDNNDLAELDLTLHPVLTATELPAELDALIGADYLTLQSSLSDAFGSLVVNDG
ncbi:hypothetical protein [Streptomyces sp. NPDC004788]